MADVGFVGRVLCAGTAFSAVALHSACHSLVVTAYNMIPTTSATSPGKVSEYTGAAKEKAKLHNERLLCVHLKYQKDLELQGIRHSRELQQMQEQLFLAKQKLTRQEAQDLHKVYDPLNAHQLAKAEGTAFSASSLHTMLNSAYRENDFLSEQLQQQKQAAEELLQEGFRAVETITAQRQELESLHQQVQLLQQQLANFCNAEQYAELQAAASTPLAKATNQLKRTGWLPKDFSPMDPVPAQCGSNAEGRVRLANSYEAPLLWGKEQKPGNLSAEQDQDLEAGSGSDSSSPWKLFTPVALPRSSLTPRSSSGSDSVFENPIFAPGESSDALEQASYPDQSVVHTA